MQTVLIAGAGKSSSALIAYMLNHARQQWKVVVMDANVEMIADKLNGHSKGEAAVIDVYNEKDRSRLVESADIVVSLMPPDLHILLAKDCIKYKKNLITSSYVSDEMRAMDREVREAGLLFMCEMGVDPGIDHMSANSIIHGVQRIAGRIKSFKSVCGGLVAPESDDNPWHYKISWNSKNVVLAGKAGASWLENGRTCSLDYQNLFSQQKKIKIDGIGPLVAYPNRDSLKYLDLYDLPDVKTFVRSTLRHPSYMKGWNTVVAAGLTDEHDRFDAEEATFAGWIAAKTGVDNDHHLRANFQKKWQVEDKEMKLFDWLRIFENRLINVKGTCSSATILLSLLEERWKMKPTDKDLVVMQHQIDYERKGRFTKLTSTLVVKGTDRHYSAMAKTVGLPMAILAEKILKSEINISRLKGVHIPVMPEIYVPVLKALKKNGIEFIEDIE
jgi:saccharopine dehydrogenase-like NADP-dependent oxidoreductase